MSKKIIAITGATGAQGGGLARAILSDPESPFLARAITRNPDSDKAKALAELGAEVVQADLDDVESLKRAFDGAYGAFCLTNFWEHFSPDKEKAQAQNMAVAAKATGVQHVVWSTFSDTRKWLPITDDSMPVLLEKYNVPHFDAKAEADAYFGERDVPTTYLISSFYWENFIYFGAGPQRGEDGVLYITMPMGDKKLPSMASEDIGRSVYGILKAGETYVGQTVGVAGEHLTGADIAAAFTEALGEEVRYNAVPADVFRGFDFPGADEMGNMYQFKRDFNDAYCGERDLEQVRKLNPQLQSFASWLAENKDRVPIG